MKKSNINVLLVALTSAVALAACNSGSSPTPAPTPSPTPTPTPTPTPSPTPTPTPTPVPGESGVYALSGTILSATYSTTPSTNAWVNYTSGTTNRIVGAVASESSALLLDTSSLPTGTATSTQAMTYGLYTTTGSQVVNSGNTLAVSVDVTGSTSAVTYLPAISTNQSASNGSDSVVVAPATATSDATGAVTVATYKMYNVTAAGVPTAFTGYNDISGGNTPLATVPADTVVAFVNGMYYAYNVAGANTLLQSSNGTSWQQITNNTVLNSGATNIATVVQVSGTVFAALDDAGGLYLGSSPANLTYISTTNPVTSIASKGNGQLFVYYYNSPSQAGDMSLYTPTASALRGAIASNATGALRPMQPGSNLVFAGDSIYETNNGMIYPVYITANSISTNMYASTDLNGNVYLFAEPADGGFLFALGANLMQVNNRNTYTDWSGGNSTTNNGSISAVSAVDALTGQATFTNLPTGYSYTDSVTPVDSIKALPVGFAGSTSGYMMALNNGAILVSSANGFVPASTVMTALNGANSEGMPANLTKLASASDSYLATDATNLYYSNNNGTSWTVITPASVFGTGTAATLNINTSANGLYFINVTSSATTSQNGIYQTATPQTLSTWVKINTTPLNVTYNYWGGQYYQLTDGTSNVGVYKTTTNQTAIYNNVLPQNAVNVGGAFNVAYNGSSYALAQVSSNYLWTSASLIDGVSGWTQNVSVFTGVGGAALSSETFSGPLTWTGKVWVATGAAGNIYTATAPTSFTVGTYTNTTGATAPVNGGVASGLF